MSIGKTFAVLVLMFAFVVAILVPAMISFHNTEVGLRTQYQAKTDANKADFDNTWKTINQVAQVPAKYKDDFQAVYESYMQARSNGNTGQGELLSFLTEAVPQYDAQLLYSTVQTVIESKRESWTTRQKELRDVKREHDQLLRQFPGVFYNLIFQRDELPIMLVTSDKTEKAFEIGVDNDLDIF